MAKIIRHTFLAHYACPLVLYVTRISRSIYMYNGEVEMLAWLICRYRQTVDVTRDDTGAKQAVSLYGRNNDAT